MPIGLLLCLIAFLAVMGGSLYISDNGEHPSLLKQVTSTEIEKTSDEQKDEFQIFKDQIEKKIDEISINAATSYNNNYGDHQAYKHDISNMQYSIQQLEIDMEECIGKGVATDNDLIKVANSMCEYADQNKKAGAIPLDECMKYAKQFLNNFYQKDKWWEINLSLK